MCQLTPRSAMVSLLGARPRLDAHMHLLYMPQHASVSEPYQRQACCPWQVERERQAEGAKAGGLHQAKRDAHAHLKRLTKDLQARTSLCGKHSIKISWYIDT